MFDRSFTESGLGAEGFNSPIKAAFVSSGFIFFYDSAASHSIDDRYSRIVGGSSLFNVA